MLIANLSATEKPIDINNLPARGGIASARGPFDYLTLIDSGLLTHDEADRLRPRIYENLKQGVPDDEYDAMEEGRSVRFVKCHDAYTYTADGEPLLGGANGADGAIVIVRDPRDVAPSLANHNSTTLDAAIDFMEDAAAAFCGKTNQQANQLRQQLPGWGKHIESWLTQTDIPVHLVRYEDMKMDTAGALRRALAFAGSDADGSDIERAVAFADFSELKRQETDIGFREAPPKTLSGFFRRGEMGSWRDELTIEQVSRIEAAHAPTMRRLGYALSSALARVG
jgi:hypothetical protein